VKPMGEGYKTSCPKGRACELVTENPSIPHDPAKTRWDGNLVHTISQREQWHPQEPGSPGPGLARCDCSLCRKHYYKDTGA
jgi:hypothetical protein